MNTVRDLMVLRLWHWLEAKRSGYTYDKAATRYRDNATGRFIAESVVRGQMESYNRMVVRDNVDRLTERLVTGKATLEQWQTGMAREIKDAFIVNAQIGRGGRAQMTQADWGRVGGNLKREYEHLNQFAAEINTGKLTEREVANRARLYADGARKIFFTEQTMSKAESPELTQERRVLNIAEHCMDCVAYAGQGWQPIGSLPNPGEASACGSNCRCFKEYR